MTLGAELTHYEEAPPYCLLSGSVSLLLTVRTRLPYYQEASPISFTPEQIQDLLSNVHSCQLLPDVSKAQHQFKAPTVRHIHYSISIQYPFKIHRRYAFNIHLKISFHDPLYDPSATLESFMIHYIRDLALGNIHSRSISQSWFRSPSGIISDISETSLSLSLQLSISLSLSLSHHQPDLNAGAGAGKNREQVGRHREAASGVFLA